MSKASEKRQKHAFVIIGASFGTAVSLNFTDERVWEPAYGARKEMQVKRQEKYRECQERDAFESTREISTFSLYVSRN